MDRSCQTCLFQPAPAQECRHGAPVVVFVFNFFLGCILVGGRGGILVCAFLWRGIVDLAFLAAGGLHDGGDGRRGGGLIGHAHARCPGLLVENALGEAGGDDGDLDLVLLELVVAHGSEDDLGFGVDGLGDDLGGVLDLEHCQVLAAGDREQDALGSGDRNIEEWRIDGGAGGFDGAILADGRADAHEGRAGILHDRTDVREVDVDQAGRSDEIRYALDGMAQDVVAHGEGVLDGRALVDGREQAVVGDDDDGVDFLAELFEAGFGDAAALAAFEEERLGHDGDREAAELLGDAGYDRRYARAGAAALAAGHEDHIGAFDDFLDLITGLLRRAASEVGIHAGAQAACQVLTQIDALLGERAVQVLRVRIDGDEVDATDLAVDHVVDGIAAGAADAEDLDARECFDVWSDIGHGLITGRQAKPLGYMVWGYIST